MPNDEANSTKDYVIVGAGPAGIQLGYFFESSGRDYVILEAGEGCATFFKHFPRHRTMISINKVYSGYDERELQMRWDWNSLIGPDDDIPFSAYSRAYFPPANALVGYLNDFARRHRIKFQFRTKVSSIAPWTDEAGNRLGYCLTDQDGRVVRARRVIVASGYSKPNLPPIDGIEHTEPYATMSAQPDDFADQRVLVIGKGNSGFETAERVIPTARMIHIVSPSPVEFAWRTHHVGNLRALNNNFLDTYQLKSQNAVLDAQIDRIRRDEEGIKVRFRYTHNTEVEEITYDRVLNCTGFRFDPSIFAENCQPSMRECGRLPLMDACWESVDLPGVYFAGVLTQVRDYRKSSSAFIHGFRYNARALFRLLEQKYENVPWPSRKIEPTPDAIVGAMLERINRSAGLWQQFGYLCDVVLKGEGGVWRYLEEMPIEHVVDNPAIGGSECFTVTLEYGPKRLVDPFNQSGRVVRTDASNAESSAFLHPVIRRYRAGNLVATHHVIEDLAAEWYESEHIDPLREFLREQLSARRAPRHSDIRELAGTESVVARGKAG